jgi:GGDEF domain-containing protein
MAALVDLASMVMAQIELQHAFGRIDPVSGLPTRHQFRDDLIDLARDRTGEQRLAVVIDIARDDQISRITRVMGGSRVDDMIREATQALVKILGKDRNVYHVGPVQFAFLSPPGVEQADYIQALQSGFKTVRAS